MPLNFTPLKSPPIVLGCRLKKRQACLKIDWKHWFIQVCSALVYLRRYRQSNMLLKILFNAAREENYLVCELMLLPVVVKVYLWNQGHWCKKLDSQILDEKFFVDFSILSLTFKKSFHDSILQFLHRLLLLLFSFRNFATFIILSDKNLQDTK